MSAVIEFKDVRYSFTSANDDAVAVKDLSFSIPKGQMLAIVGGNGAGKTTTSKLMNGLLKPSSGSVLIQGMDTASVPTSHIAKTVGMLFQNPDHQICRPTVFDEVAFSLQLLGMKGDQAQQRTQEVLDEFELDGTADPFTLSRGMRQVVALASVIVGRPEVLILDEPTNGLDYRECMNIMNHVKALRDAGTTVVMITHDMELAYDFAERIVVMADGHIVADGDPFTVFTDSSSLQTAHVLPPQVLDAAQRASQRLDGVVAQQLVRAMTIDQVVKACRPQCTPEASMVNALDGSASKEGM